jgi:tetratricopeptide repeat protein
VIELINRNKKVLIALFFAAYLITGLFAVKDYGISWDEVGQQQFGTSLYRYIVEGDPTFFYADRANWYGAAFTMLLVFSENMLNINDSQSLYITRHLITFLFFFLGVFFFFMLCSDYFGNWKYGLLGSLFLVLSPRIFSHSFYNLRDTTFLAAFTIAVYSLVKLLDRKTFFWVIIHALTCSVLIGIRILGIMMPAITVFIFILDFIQRRENTGENLKVMGKLFMYFVMMLFLTVLLWPYLWEDPFKYLFLAFEKMSHHPWEGKVLFCGDYIKSLELPSHYISTWIAVSTPVMYMIFFVVGIFGLAISTLKRPLDLFFANKKDLLMLIWCFSPLVLVVVMKSVLYDGWRHLFFIYPAFLLITLIGVRTIFSFSKGMKHPLKSIYRAIVASYIILSTLQVAMFMISNHPYQHVYFNMFAGRDMEEAKNNFEMDYWGLSYKESLEKILEIDSRENIKVLAANDPGKFNLMIIDKKDRGRIEFVDKIVDADYFITNYRMHKDEYPMELTEIFAIEVGNAKIQSIYDFTEDKDGKEVLYYALDSAENALTFEGESAEIYVYMGINLMELGMHQKAIEALKSALRLDPSSSVAYESLIVYYYNDKKFNLANKYVKEAKKNDCEIRADLIDAVREQVQ